MSVIDVRGDIFVVPSITIVMCIVDFLIDSLVAGVNILAAAAIIIIRQQPVRLEHRSLQQTEEDYNPHLPFATDQPQLHIPHQPLVSLREPDLDGHQRKITIQARPVICIVTPRDDGHIRLLARAGAFAGEAADIGARFNGEARAVDVREATLDDEAFQTALEETLGGVVDGARHAPCYEGGGGGVVRETEMEEEGVGVVGGGVSGVEEVGPEGVRERDGEGPGVAAVDEGRYQVTGLLEGGWDMR